MATLLSMPSGLAVGGGAELGPLGVAAGTTGRLMQEAYEGKFDRSVLETGYSNGLNRARREREVSALHVDYNTANLDPGFERRVEDILRFTGGSVDVLSGQVVSLRRALEGYKPESQVAEIRETKKDLATWKLALRRISPEHPALNTPEGPSSPIPIAAQGVKEVGSGPVVREAAPSDAAASAMPNPGAQAQDTQLGALKFPATQISLPTIMQAPAVGSGVTALVSPAVDSPSPILTVSPAATTATPNVMASKAYGREREIEGLADEHLRVLKGRLDKATHTDRKVKMRVEFPTPLPSDDLEGEDTAHWASPERLPNTNTVGSTLNVEALRPYSFAGENALMYMGYGVSIGYVGVVGKTDGQIIRPPVIVVANHTDSLDCSTRHYRDVAKYPATKEGESQAFVDAERRVRRFAAGRDSGVLGFLKRQLMSYTRPAFDRQTGRHPQPPHGY